MSSQKRSLDTLIGRLSDGAFVQRAWSDAKMAYWLMKQRDVPIITKVLPIATLIYTLAPVDIIPDFLPVLGQMDDVAVIMLGIRAFLHFAPPSVVGRYEAELAGTTVVEGEVEKSD